ncbi:hypothetical protein HYW99_01025 [Candidatus Woesearchaeota archaeon]|nr:hypothetical protein [Candidatus Woesearchaeota archaeon]
MFYLRSQDLYYLLRIYDENMNTFWYSIISVVIGSLILMIILVIYYLKNGLNTNRGIILSLIFILSPLITILYNYFNNAIDKLIIDFFTQSFYVSLVMVLLSYVQGKIDEAIEKKR